MTRRRGLVALIGLAILLIGAVIALPLVVRAVAIGQARDRGLALEFESLTFGLNRIWLGGARLTAAEFPQVIVSVPWIEVQVGTRGVRFVRVHGAQVVVSGPTDALVEQLKRARSGDAQAAPRSTPRTPISIVGASLTWRPQPGESYDAWGLSAERNGDSLRVALDLLRAASPAVSLEAKQLRLSITLPGFELTSLEALSSEGRINLDQFAVLEQTHTVEAVAPAVDPAPEKSPLLGLLELSPGRGQRLRQKVSRLTGIVARRLPENASVDLGDLSLKLARRGSLLNIGPGRMKLSRNAGEVVGSFAPGSEGTSGGQSVRLEFRSPVNAGPLEVRLAGGPIQLAKLGIGEGEFGLTNVAGASVELDSFLSLSADGTTADFSSTGSFEGLSVFHRRIAPEPIVDMGFKWEGTGQLQLDGSRVRIESGKLQLDAAAVNFSADVKREPKRLVLSLEAEVPLAACQAMFDSLPRAVVGKLENSQFGGTFSWRASLFADTDQLEQAKASWRMQNDCVLKQVSAEISPARFRQPFTRLVQGQGEQMISIQSGPGSDGWVAIQQMSPYLETAVTVTEDGGFWGHRGFDQRAIESSIRQNVQAGKFVRGASTITMQLAKNLYLSREKHVSRKIQEALLTMLLEQEFRKDEILELYFNSIEFGPDIYGIGPAARHYFKSEAQDLSIAQSFFLASILPNPKANHFNSDNTLKSGWLRYVHRLLRIAHEREKITEAELQEALEQEVIFGVPDSALVEAQPGAAHEPNEPAPSGSSGSAPLDEPTGL